MTAELVGDLRPAEHHRVGPLGRAGQLLEHLDLGGHQRARVVRQQRGDVVHRGLLAVHHAEAVGDERAVGADQFGQLPWPAPAARRRPCWSPAGRSGCSPAAGRRRRSAPRRAPARRCPTTSPASCTCRPSCSPSAAATGASESFGSGPPFGRPRCAVTTTLAPASTSAFSVGTEAMMRPGSVIVAVVVERDVQVGAHQHAPTLETPSASRSSSVLTAIASTATCRPARPGRRGGWSSPTRCRTRTRPWPGCRSPWSGPSRRSSCAGR